jgi:predicted DNA binding protein
MTVEEGLAILKGREPRQFSLDEIADFTGVSNDTIQRIEVKALRKLSEKVVR